MVTATNAATRSNCHYELTTMSNLVEGNLKCAENEDCDGRIFTIPSVEKQNVPASNLGAANLKNISVSGVQNVHLCIVKQLMQLSKDQAVEMKIMIICQILLGRKPLRY